MNNVFAAVENLGITLGSKKILSRVNLKIKRGEFVTIVGPNGSGKTTLVKSLLGLIKPGCGKVFLNTKLYGYIPQSSCEERGFPATAWELIENSALSTGMDKAAVKKEISEIVTELKIQKILKSRFYELSGGEKQKVMLAMVLVRKPELLVLDEPNLNLDPYAYLNFLKLADSIHKKHNITVIFVTHMINAMPFSSARVVVLKKGEISFDGMADKLFGGKNAMEKIYG
ncbi:MAG: hypothetical protein CVV21_04640 [Candidatus Goldiibacteriota bacterium HGW-Goldbacteria-1]|jgi:zinc transport system ATP-binding protein|nr:MAG: hypothetical protein CVV21_04640 [Candidatus Goldiibacteriota bacterium HGW-Goldbacteria-1]